MNGLAIYMIIGCFFFQYIIIKSNALEYFSEASVLASLTVVISLVMIWPSFALAVFFKKLLPEEDDCV
ncbi:hypothetical protein [Vibrio salinus]|uniref:hypothetical protein n=1 Tax=Vibrio salinus TaxID=2899784 RepID=UPI001E34A9C3|nr:hypothetical protein [Vibrio salinus]MCE0492946.1 hypothetical protein [Vibrio salinus]